MEYVIVMRRRKLHIVIFRLCVVDLAMAAHSSENSRELIALKKLYYVSEASHVPFGIWGHFSQVERFGAHT